MLTGANGELIKNKTIIVRVLLLSLIMVMLLSSIIYDIPAKAFTGNYSKMQSIIITDTSGTARTNLPVILASINGTTYVPLGYINANGTDTAMTDNATWADTEYMMDTIQSSMVVPSLPAYGSRTYQLLMGASVNQTNFPIITGVGGYTTVTDVPALELSDNYTMTWNGYVDTTDVGENLFYKTGAVTANVSGSGNVSFWVTSGSSVTASGLTSGEKDIEIIQYPPLSFEGNTSNYGGNVFFTWGDDNYIYAGGDTTQTIRKYNKNTLDYITQSPSYGGTITTLWTDDTYIYAGGTTTQTVRKYLKSDLSYIGETASYGVQISTIRGDDTYIYVGGSTQTVRKYLKSDLSYIGETANYGGSVNNIWVDSTYLYAVGGTTQTIRKYLKSDLSYISESANYGGNVLSIWADDTHLYIGGQTTQTVRKYLKSDLSYIGETASYGGNIFGIWGTDTHIYAGGATTQTIRKYLKSDLSYIGETASLGGQVSDFWGDYSHIFASVSTGPVDIKNINKYSVGSLQIYVDSVLKDTDYLNVNAVPDTANNYIIGSNATPYINSFSITIDGVEQCLLEPTIMLTSTTVPDESGHGHTGTITWGTNTGLTISYGSVIDAQNVRTDDASGVQSTSAYLYGAVVSLGSSTYVNVGFQYGQDTSYGLGTTPLQQFTAANLYYYPVTGLAPNTTYHFRAVLVYGVSSYIYGEDKTFTTLPVTGSSTTIEIKSAKMFQNYITTGDLLLTVEALNTYTYLYPNQSPRTHFTIQLLGTNGSTILGAAPLSNWGDRPSSIYFNPTVVTANISIGTAYYVRMIGDEQSGNASTTYQLIPSTTENSDWEGSDLTNLDEWCIGTAKNMGVIDASNQDYYLTDSTDRGKVIGDNGAGFFNMGIPNIGQVRPKLFATSEYHTTVQTGTANNKWDSATAWQTFVGATITADVTTLAVPFGITGKELLIGVILLVMLGCVMVVVAGTGGTGALGAVLISTPILWVGTYFRILPAAVMIVTVIIFGMFAIRQFVIKTL